MNKVLIIGIDALDPYQFSTILDLFKIDWKKFNFDGKSRIKEGMNEYEGEIVLVTGGAGRIGTNLCRKFAELNTEKVMILDDLSRAYEWNIPRAKNIVFVKGRILDDEMLKRVFKEKPDYVFQLVAHFTNQNSVDNPEKDLLVNGMKTLKYIFVYKAKKLEGTK